MNRLQKGVAIGALALAGLLGGAVAASAQTTDSSTTPTTVTADDGSTATTVPADDSADSGTKPDCPHDKANADAEAGTTS